MGHDDDFFDESEDGPMVDDYYFTNGADRDYTGRFAQWEKRIFYADGRTKLDATKIADLAYAICALTWEIQTFGPRLSLRAMADLRRYVDTLEHELVALVRSYGWSWRDISDATGLSRSGLHKRFAQHDVPNPKRRG